MAEILLLRQKTEAYNTEAHEIDPHRLPGHQWG